MEIKDIKNKLVDYIENNKTKYNIDYADTIESIKELIKEIENDYENLEVMENEF